VSEPESTVQGAGGPHGEVVGGPCGPGRLLQVARNGFPPINVNYFSYVVADSFPSYKSYLFQDCE
jgi:hypothetical protein